MEFTTDQLNASFRLMFLIRRFEETLNAIFLEGEVAGTCHLCIGQEAIPAGIALALTPDDYVNGTHRGHGHFIARGGDPKLIMAEVFGREAGYSRGRGGSQHMAAFGIGFLGSNGITGGGIPTATGAALAVKQKGEKKVVVATMGDGAANQGVFHECVNMAVLWKLPVIYVCENNFYAMSTPFSKSCAVSHVADRVRGFGLPTKVVDGNDVLAVARAVGEAVRNARDGKGPAFIECVTYRLCGHSRSDQCVYREREEEAKWAAECPIDRFREKMLSGGVATAEEIAGIEASVNAQMEEAEEFARSAPASDVGTLTDGLFADEEGGAE